MSKIERESFVFYRSFYDSIKKLKKTDRLQALDAIISYALDGEIIKTDGISEAIFLAIRPQIDANNKRYENGKKGGRKPKDSNSESLARADEPDNNMYYADNKDTNEKKPTDIKSEDKKEPNENVNVNVNDNVNDNVNVNVNVNELGSDDQKFFDHDTHTDSQNQSKIKFADFWELYPKRVNEKQALIEWQRIKPDEQTAQQIIDGVRMWSSSLQWQQDGGKYIPHPATYLRTERWKDISAINVNCRSSNKECGATSSYNLSEFDRYTLGEHICKSAENGGKHGT